MCILAVNDASFISLSTLNIHNEVIHFNSMKYVNIYFSNISSVQFVNLQIQIIQSLLMLSVHSKTEIVKHYIYIHVHTTYSLHFD